MVIETDLLIRSMGQISESDMVRIHTGVTINAFNVIIYVLRHKALLSFLLFQFCLNTPRTSFHNI